MKFTLNTKPFKDAISLGIINSNVSKFYQKSNIAQLEVTKDELKLNLEAASILTEITLKGNSDEDSTEVVFVDALLLKQLMNTIESQTVTLEFMENGLTIHSGKSKFRLNKVVDGDEVRLGEPVKRDNPGYTFGEPKTVNKAEWKFINSYQMYSIANSYTYPAYTRVWVGENGTVLVGDFDNGIFTKSDDFSLGTTCLLTNTIINLLNNVPENSTLTRVENDNSFILEGKTDGFTYCTQFIPDYEETVGSYHSDIVLDTFVDDDSKVVMANVEQIKKTLAQAELLAKNSDDIVTLSVDKGTLELKNDNVDAKTDVTGNQDISYECSFNIGFLKSVISNMDDNSIKICPMFSDENEEIVGVEFSTDKLSVILAGVEQ